MGITWSHGGSLPGSRTAFWHFANGTCYAFLFNGDSKDQASLVSYVAQGVWNALNGVTEWPDHDLFPQYYPPVIAPSGVVNAASFLPGPLAPGSLVTIVGADLGGKNAEVRVRLREASGVDRPLNVLYSGTGQINTILPGEALPGDATLTVQREGWPDAIASLSIVTASPGLFTLNEEGLVAASLVRSRPGQQQSWEQVFQVDTGGGIIARPIRFGPEDEVLSLVLYCTGVRGSRADQGVIVHIGESAVVASYAGPQLEFAGLDQVNIILPRTLSGAGDVSIQVDVEGLPSNTAWVRFQ